MKVEHVLQEDYCGCLVACLAMVTGRTYRDVKAWEGFVGKNFRERSGGLTYHDVLQYLSDHGHAGALRFRWLPGCSDSGHHTRNPWPTDTFAPAHILGVTNGGQHGVVLLPDGTVLDPQHATPRQLEDYGDVAYMLGIFKVAA
jgi:hypothetical protein